MANEARILHGRWWLPTAALLAVLGCALAPVVRAGPKVPSAVEHESLSATFESRTQRIHRFRLRVPELRAEVVDLGFERSVAEGLGSFAFAVNGGYWEWHLGRRRMIGLVVSNGKQLSPLRRKLDGGVLLVDSLRARILRAHQAVVGADTRVAVQCRPRLVESGKPVPALSESGHAARTVVCTRDAGGTLDVYLTDPRGPGTTLSEMASWLAAEGCNDALNFDGGPSTAAAYREPAARGVARIGLGIGLPYAIRFAPR